MELNHLDHTQKLPWLVWPPSGEWFGVHFISIHYSLGNTLSEAKSGIICCQKIEHVVAGMFVLQELLSMAIANNGL